MVRRRCRGRQRKGHEVVVKLLVEKGADMESKDSSGRTPLWYAATKAVAQLLIEKGADVESKDEWGRTPLSIAAENGQDAVIQLLIEKGADVDSKDSYGQTRATAFRHEGVVQLLEAGRRNGAGKRKRKEEEDRPGVINEGYRERALPWWVKKRIE
jgi:ankyrin repeat protein